MSDWRVAAEAENEEWEMGESVRVPTSKFSSYLVKIAKCSSCVVATARSQVFHTLMRLEIFILLVKREGRHPDGDMGMTVLLKNHGFLGYEAMAERHLKSKVPFLKRSALNIFETKRS